MAPTILIVGATGNTGRGVMDALPKLLPSSTLSSHRIMALTRCATSATAQQLAKLDGVTVVEQNWVEITADWLREREVRRVFIASHNQPNQFAEESQFLVNALRAGVKYVVRISTTAANVRPDFMAYYPRTHWAIEEMLSQPAFADMHWSSLQPNVFLSQILWPAVEYIERYRAAGTQQGLTLGLMLNANSPVGAVDAHEVGVLAAHLLVQDDTQSRNHARYVVNGPEDTTGEAIVRLVEQHIDGEKVNNVKYKDLSLIDHMAEQGSESKNVILSIKHAVVTGYEGKCTAATTSREVLELAAPKRTAAEVLAGLLEG
ncbi:hypothetical protein BC832DRAFT_560871 [Gaertneriomyces semiglobifer]|nr:hypothetical protein BC832DRAFT_560871 [Gaertneriomyces semiglobifer]